VESNDLSGVAVKQFHESVGGYIGRWFWLRPLGSRRLAIGLEERVSAFIAVLYPAPPAGLRPSFAVVVSTVAAIRSRGGTIKTIGCILYFETLVVRFFLFGP